MMKRLLFSALSALFAFSANAVEVGEYVYTPSGRYQLGAQKTSLILDEEMTGWSSISDDALPDNFQVADGYVSAVAAANTKGLYKSFTLDDNDKTYVLVFDAKANGGAFATTFTPKYLGAAGDHIAHLNVFATESGEYVNTATAAGTVSKQADLGLGFQLTGEYQTYATALTNGGSDLTWFIEMSQLLDGISIGNIQIYEATQVFDNRFVQNKIDYLNAIINVYDWEKMKKSEADTNLWNFIKETPENLANMADATTVEAGKEIIDAVNDSIVRFCATFFGDYAADQKIRFQDATSSSVAKSTAAVAGWAASNRWWHDKGSAAIKYWGNYAYGNANTENVTQKVNLSAGAYVFAVDAYLDAMGKKGTINNHGYGYYSSDTRSALCRGKLTLSILDSEGVEKFKGTTIALDNITPLTGVVAFYIPEGQDGEYTFKIAGLDTYEAQSIGKVGGNGHLNDLRIFFKASGEYDAKQLNYIRIVKEQIKAMRDAYNKSITYSTDTEKYYWYKQAVADTAAMYAPYLEFYEALDTATIINGFDDPLSKEAKEAAEAEAGTEFPEWDYNLSYDKYAALTQNAVDSLTSRAVRPLLRLNERFVAYNQVLFDMLDAIEKGQVILNTRVFSQKIAYGNLEQAVKDASDLFEVYKEDPGDVSTLVEVYIPEVQSATGDINNIIANFYESDYNPGSEPTIIRSFDFEDAEAFTLTDPNADPGAGSYVTPEGLMTFTNLELGTTGGNNYTFCNGYLQDGAWTSQGFLRVGGNSSNSGSSAPVVATVQLDEEEVVAGSDALHVSFDFYFGNYSGRSAGVYLNDAEGGHVTGLYGSKYDNNWLTTAYNPFQIDGDKDFSGVGSSSASNLAIVAESNKTHFDFYLDYGTKEMFVVVNNASKGTVNKRFDAVMENQNPVTQFVVGSNYNNNDRRCWFDNLVIEKIPLPVPTGYYTVNIAEGIENGTVTAVPSTAKAGDEVTIKATPAEGYKLASVSVTGVNTNKAIEVVDGKFTMPEDDVTVNAEFSLKGDVNGDGVVDGTDIQVVINIILAETNDPVGDVNGDGEVDGTDIQEIINIILQN